MCCQQVKYDFKMEDVESLSKQVKLAETQGSLEEVSELISKLFIQNDDAALDLCLKLAMSEFGGITYKDDFQNVAALGALHWGPKGIVRLGAAVIKTNSFRSISNATRLLSPHLQ